MATGQVFDCSTGLVQTVTVAPPSLSEAKADKWDQAKTERDRRITAGCTVPGVGTFDTDEVSRGNITGAVTMALIAQGAGAPYSIGWKLADNTIATLNAAGMIGAGGAVGQYVAACHANVQGLGLAIEAASDLAAVAAIDVGAGWP